MYKITPEVLKNIIGTEITLGKFLLAIRKDKKISQVKFAKLLGISRQYLGKIEDGERIVSSELAAEFANKLGYSALRFRKLTTDDKKKALLKKFLEKNKTVNTNKLYRLHNVYSKEKKQEAIEMIKNGIKIPEINKKIGINLKTLYRWKKKLKEEEFVMKWNAHVDDFSYKFDKMIKSSCETQEAQQLGKLLNREYKKRLSEAEKKETKLEKPIEKPIEKKVIENENIWKHPHLQQGDFMYKENKVSKKSSIGFFSTIEVLIFILIIICSGIINFFFNPKISIPINIIFIIFPLWYLLKHKNK